ncbi:hypothetical protein Cgig2_003647 [Carnegiea gigantea]|uniref:Prolyl 4-hydroxylase alpha subunit Fe(2+) 2OG dioxygenase domain-containing protein n=1 Tax=Carnegiea gigantea TaxID=171969 RepID=A0A9Q1GTP0_9CARY|nr:hypothetical protein Cgig2_003647 [Carnegiea gigantea]
MGSMDSKILRKPILKDYSNQPKSLGKAILGGLCQSLCENLKSKGLQFTFCLQDHIVARIEERIAAWTFLPSENGEALQIIRYKLVQRYEPHVDYLEDEFNQLHGGHRIATVLIYLPDVKKGGETVTIFDKRIPCEFCFLGHNGKSSKKKSIASLILRKRAMQVSITMNIRGSLVSMKIYFALT